jgi:cytosine/uracil/thiamine/allantoin permease
LAGREVKMIIFLFGIFIGGFIGIIIMSIFFIGKREDIFNDELYRNFFTTK